MTLLQFLFFIKHSEDAKNYISRTTEMQSRKRQQKHLEGMLEKNYIY